MNQPRQQPEEPTSPGLAHYFDLIVRHRWWVISSGCVAWALAIVASLVIPAKYKSETTILIEQPKVSAQFLPQNVTVDLQQRLQSLTEQILSRPRLEQIMDTFQLYGKQQNQHATDGMVDRMRKDIDIELLKTPGHDLSGFKLSYSAKSPVLAQKVAGELTSLFIQENLSNQRQLSEDTTAFLDSQLAEARKDLEQQEKTLGEFRSKYLGELPEQLAGNVQILSGLQSRLQSETEALNQAEQQRLYLVSLVGESKSARPKPAGDPGLASSSSTTALDEQIDKMKSDLAALLTRYTPQHPDVIRLQEQIASAEKLRQQAAQDPKGGKKSVESGPQVISPVAQLESQLKANELEIANRKQQVKSLEAQIEQYQALAA